MDQRWGNQGSKKRLKTELRFLRYLGRVWGGLGKVWGGSWEGLGRILEGFWEGLGALWPLQGLFSIVSGLCWALLAFPSLFLLFLVFLGLSQSFLASLGLWKAFAGLCWALLFLDAFLIVLSSFLAVLACCYYWGASEASEQSERAKLSGAFSGFSLLTHAFAGVPLLSHAFSCFASLLVIWHFLFNGTLAFPHSLALLFLAVPCLLLVSLVLSCVKNS